MEKGFVKGKYFIEYVDEMSQKGSITKYCISEASLISFINGVHKLYNVIHVYRKETYDFYEVIK